jgi:hypothetical protein
MRMIRKGRENQFVGRPALRRRIARCTPYQYINHGAAASIVLRALHSKESTDHYLRAKRSKSAICEAISSRAESAAERIP